jgi:hypothetical protein
MMSRVDIVAILLVWETSFHPGRSVQTKPCGTYRSKE